ncbi:hypothetical protein HU200_045476 [Digitaria exilis]|uniref:Uncharacterized protein n=1 Tax=Digitaria exilis TaxID=1010633 RepID=A0A835EEU7_9POAL|nr:hypothetical protein HU200_045476 [Digitaria exilis]
MDISSYLTVGGWFIQVIFDKYLSYKLQRWAANCGIDHELDRLRVALLRTQSVLHGTEVAPTLSNSSLPWMRELRDVMYHAEDLLEKLEYNRLHHEMEESGANVSSSSPISTFMHSRFCDQGAPASSLESCWDRSTKVKNKMVNLLERIEQVASGVSEALSLARNIRSNNHNIMTSSITHGSIIGQDFNAQELVTTLTSSQDENPISVVSIVGVGGRGKTALAQHVYNDTRITENFNVRMWICVTYLFDELRITKEMLESASNSRFRHDGTTNFNRIQVALKARLASKRFLLVLDDVWSNDNMTIAMEQENWQKLLAPLKYGAKGSKILLTTLSSMVAEMLQSSCIISLEALTVLNLSGCRLGKLPSRMNNLVNLRHLTAANQIVSSITDIGRMKCLQRLPIFKVTREQTQSIVQLGYLLELQGSLQIRNLENINTPDEAKDAMLCKKGQLSVLQLMWAPDRDEVNTNREENVLEALQPHENLKRLDIMGWSGVKSPIWLENEWLSNLEHIFLSGCKAWEQLPPLGQLPSIRTIWLQRLKMLRQIGLEAYGIDSQQEPFQSLEELVLDDMPELNEWLWSGRAMRNLHSVVIKDCNKLKALPPVPPNLTEITSARKGYWMPYHHDVKLAHATTARSSVSSLCIFNCPVLLARLSSPMTNEISASFGLLRSIITDQIAILRSPLLRERLELIESLDIQDCSGITSFSADDNDVLLQLKSLQSLCISGCNTLRSLPSTLSRIQTL